MFTGIITALGEVEQLEGAKLTISAPVIVGELALGKSVAVNGVCLTAIAVNSEKGEFMADVSPETLRRTNLGLLKPKDRVNLELPMRLGDRFDGHIVLGHVDTTAEIIHIKPEHESWIFSFTVTKGFDGFLIEKGSVALDGISLTAFNIKRGKFDVAIVPHTFRVTNLQHRRVGDRVNVEFDLFAKHIEKLVRVYGVGHSRS